MTSNVLIFDTETTSIDNPILIEASGIYIDGNPKDIKIIDTFSQRYNPGINIDIEAMTKHNIIDEDLVDCPSSKDFVFDSNVVYLIGHNIDFDHKVIGEPNVFRIDTLAIARFLWPNLPKHNLVYLTYISQEDRRKARELVVNAHNSLQDCYMVMELLKHFASKIPQLTSWDNLYKLSQHSRIPQVMPFGKYKGQSFDKIPTEYKMWVLNNMEIDSFLRDVINKSMGD